jgi:DNA repair exonuclease SbcCD nuclease subunit
VFRKTSLSDPTAWITEQAVDCGRVRIGMAHGSLKIREDLPADDHLIAVNAAHDLRLDYLALGHWHSRKFFRDSEGIERTAYCGVHEPLGFPGSSGTRTGWVPYSAGKGDEFLDRGKGEILHVRVEGPGSPPVIEPLEVGHLSWGDEKQELTTDDDLSRLIDEVATRPAVERCLLKLKLSGVLDAHAMLRLPELRGMLDRYLFAELDESEVHLQPTDAEIQEVAGQGVLRRVLDQLQEEAVSAEPPIRHTASRAILLLYQLAREAKR